MVRIPLEDGWYLAVESAGRIERAPITAYEVEEADRVQVLETLWAGEPLGDDTPHEVECRLPRRVIEAGYRPLGAFHPERYPEPEGLV